MILTPNPISSSRFSFKGSVFSAEMSEIENFLKPGRVYDDAADEGFSIVSVKTGKVAVFAFYTREDDNEGDVISWIFTCVTPGLTHLKAVIYND